MSSLIRDISRPDPARTIRRAPAIVGGLAALTLLLAACSSGGASPSASTAASASGGGTQVTVAHTSAGDALAGPNGMTLYDFTHDTGTTPTCTGGCAQLWPPFTVPSGQTATAGTGVTASMLGTTTGANGTTQVTYNGHPLYYYSGDSAAGDAKGQGIKGIWFITAPDGTMGGAASPSPSSSSGGLNY